MRFETDRNYGHVPGRNRLGSQIGAYSAVPQPPLHRQIFRIVPERRRIPQHRDELCRWGRPQPKDQRSQIKAISFCRIANSTLVRTGLLGDTARAREEDYPSRYQIAEYLSNQVGKRKIRRFRDCSSLAANLAEN